MCSRTKKAFDSTRGSEHQILPHSGRTLKRKGYKREVLRHPDGSVGLRIQEWQIETQDRKPRMRTLVCAVKRYVTHQASTVVYLAVLTVP